MTVSYAGASSAERVLTRDSDSAARNSATRSAYWLGVTVCASTSSPISRQTAWPFSSTTNRHGAIGTSPTVITPTLRFGSAASRLSCSASSGDGGADSTTTSVPHRSGSGCDSRARVTESKPLTSQVRT